MKKASSLLLLFILLIAFVFRIYKLQSTFHFDYDQEQAAQSAYELLVNHNPTLVGQELSFQGFFLGPLHNWIQIPVYYFCDLLPDCVPYFFLIISLISITVFFLLIKKIWDIKVAAIASVVLSMSFVQIYTERAANSNYFLPLITIAILYCLHKYYKGSSYFFILGAFLCGLATVNFNPVYIFSSIAFFIAALFKKERNYKLFLVSVLAFLINYIPLLIFNLRHDNILFQNFINFVSQDTSSLSYVERFVFIINKIAFPYYVYYLFNVTNSVLTVLTLLLLIIGFRIIIQSKDKIARALLVWLVVPIIGFVFYKGHIPSYYFIQSLVPLVIILSIVARKHRALLIIFMVPFLIININQGINVNEHEGYQFKKQIVQYVIDDARGEEFNVYYQMPPGINTGYGYLFKAMKKAPVDGAKKLYILEYIDPKKFELDKYKKAFPNKNFAVKVQGDVHIIAVK